MRRPGARSWSANGKTARWKSVTVASDCAMKKSRCVRRPHRQWQLSRRNTHGCHRHRPATHGEKAIDKSSRKGGQPSEKTSCGNGGTVESVEIQRQDFPSSHRSLEISPTTRDSHIPTAPTEAGGWKSGKPKAGFPLSHRHESPFSRNLNPGPRAGFALRPTAGASRRPKRQRVVVVNREK